VGDVNMPYEHKRWDCLPCSRDRLHARNNELWWEAFGLMWLVIGFGSYYIKANFERFFDE
jgi:hypothetical protein